MGRNSNVRASKSKHEDNEVSLVVPRRRLVLDSAVVDTRTTTRLGRLKIEAKQSATNNRPQLTPPVPLYFYLLPQAERTSSSRSNKFRATSIVTRSSTVLFIATDDHRHRHYLLYNERRLQASY